MNQPYESFYESLVISKLWLCEELEKILDSRHHINPSIKVLGGWHNLMSFMLLIRRPNYYKQIDSYDKDVEAKAVADMICNAWSNVTNHIEDVLFLNFSQDPSNTVYINCSVDQFKTTAWYDTIPKGCIVCIQTSDIIDDSQDWEILQKTKDIEELKICYPMSETLYTGLNPFKYKAGDFNRLMLIGIK